jgi:uncharacterized coiled-coil DUF342 family protein
MEQDEIRNLISHHKDEISKLSQVIDELQEECRHTDIEVKNTSSGIIALRSVCKYCDKVLGYPTGDEISDVGY